MQRRRRNAVGFKSSSINWFLLRYLLASLIRASNKPRTGWQHSGGNLRSLIDHTRPSEGGTRRKPTQTPGEPLTAGEDP